MKPGYSDRLTRGFFTRDVLDVAPDLLGKVLSVRLPDDTVVRSAITEVEAYRGDGDLACHASKGRTDRTEVMFHEGGKIYIYLIYGIHWMLNVVTATEGVPQAVLIRGVEQCYGPGRVSRLFSVDRSFYGEDLTLSPRIWIADGDKPSQIKTGCRIGIDYAGDYWKSRPWRFFV